MSAAIGAALAGARTMTATASQGLALMAEVVYIAAGARAPVVMAVGNRALSAPINIHGDHSDSMLVRDSGALQLFAENAQEAYDLTVLAPRLAEHPAVLLPVLVCLDGFTITHSAEPVALLPDQVVRDFVGEYRIPHPLLKVAEPTTQGPFAMPDYFFEIKRSQVAAIDAALDILPVLAQELERLTGRRLAAMESYRLEDSELALVCMGSTAGTAKDVVDELREEGQAVGLVKLTAFRPFPSGPLREALAGRRAAGVLDRSVSPGGHPALYAEVAAALGGAVPRLVSLVAGLGGRDIQPETLREGFRSLTADGVSGDTRYLGLRAGG